MRHPVPDHRRTIGQTPPPPTDLTDIQNQLGIVHQSIYQERRYQSLPEHELIRQLVLQALAEADSTERIQVVANRDIARELYFQQVWALSWIFADNTDLGSFNWACEYLGLPTDKVRAKVRASAPLASAIECYLKDPEGNAKLELPHELRPITKGWKKRPKVPATQMLLGFAAVA